MLKKSKRGPRVAKIPYLSN